MKDSHQIWLESLPPEVRTEVEAEIATYDNPDNDEEIDINDDWRPPVGSGMGLTVEFNGEEIKTLTRAFGASTVMFEIMHDALMQQAHEVLTESSAQESDNVAAAD